MKQILTILLLFCYAFVACAGSGFVMCDKGNGQKVVEKSHEGQKHCSSENHNHQTNKKKSFTDDNCNPCYDTNIETEESFFKKSHDSIIYLNEDLGAEFQVFRKITFLNPKGAILARPPPNLNSTLIVLKKIILLI